MLLQGGGHHRTITKIGEFQSGRVENVGSSSYRIASCEDKQHEKLKPKKERYFVKSSRVTKSQ